MSRMGRRCAQLRRIAGFQDVNNLRARLIEAGTRFLVSRFLVSRGRNLRQHLIRVGAFGPRGIHRGRDIEIALARLHGAIGEACCCSRSCIHFGVWSARNCAAIYVVANHAGSARVPGKRNIVLDGLAGSAEQFGIGGVGGVAGKCNAAGDAAAGRGSKGHGEGETLARVDGHRESDTAQRELRIARTDRGNCHAGTTSREGSALILTRSNRDRPKS